MPGPSSLSRPHAFGMCKDSADSVVVSHGGGSSDGGGEMIWGRTQELSPLTGSDTVSSPPTHRIPSPRTPREKVEVQRLPFF